MKPKLVCLVIGLFFFVQDLKAQHCNPQDSLALVDLYNATDGPHWVKNTNWLKGPVYTWYGFSSFINSFVGGYSLYWVSTLNLQNNGLKGTVPLSSLQNLKFLSQLLLNGNNLTGDVPALHDLQFLRNVYLENNQFTGGVPGFDNCLNLSILDISHNQLDQMIPNNLGNHPGLTRLDLSLNKLKGSIPDFFDNFPKLEKLDLSYNQLEGPIPASIGKDIGITYLGLNDNKLSGAIPSSLLNYNRDIFPFDLSDNRLTFAGLEGIVTTYKNVGYSSQDSITINRSDTLLSVSAGGTLKNNTYNWYSGESTTKVGDSTFKIVHSGIYRVSVKNSVIPFLSLFSHGLTVIVPPKISLINPSPAMIGSQGNMLFDVSKIDLKALVKGVATDGVSKILIVSQSDIPIKFTINAGDGTISRLIGGGVNNSFIEPVNGLVVAVYTPPDGYGLDSQSNRSIQVTAKDRFGGSTSMDIQLMTPPVLLIHGMWSDPTVWQKGGFEQYLINNGLPSVYLVDYQSANAETFDPSDHLSQTARDAIFDKIEQAIQSAATKGIVVTQVDVVGHSLGGLQARGFMQDNRFLNAGRNYNKGYFHKVITIGTPHLGSELGPILYQSDRLSVLLPTGVILLKNLGQYLTEMNVGTAQRDFDPAFKTNNTALNRLASPVAYKAHAIEARYDAPGKTVKSAWMSYLSILSSATNGKSFNLTLNQILKDTTSDLIVPRYSQLGGLTEANFYDHFNFTTHSDLGVQTDFTETTNPVIQQRVRELLLTDNKALFSDAFPSPKTIKVPFTNSPLVVNDLKKPTNNQTIDFAQNNTAVNSTLRITSPSAASVVKNDGKDSLVLSFASTGSTQLSNPIFFIAGLGFVGMPESGPASVKVLLPKTISAGRLKLICLAGDPNGNMYADTLSINIKGSDTLKSIAVDAANIRLDSLNRTRQIRVTGLYINKTDSTFRDISFGQTGTTYSQLSKKNILNVSADGEITAKDAGTDTIIIKNNGLAAKMAVTINHNLLLITKFANTISSHIGIKTSIDPPFLLNGSASSGGNISYRVLSGPLTITNETATITGTGLATVLATSEGNAYFNAAIDTIRISIQKTNQQITFDPLAALVIGDPDFTPVAQASSGLTVAYHSSNLAVATIINGKIHIVGPGNTVISAGQDGNDYFNQATVVNQTLDVVASPVITADRSVVFLTGESVNLSIGNDTGHTYVWAKDGLDISGATNAKYKAVTGGSYTISIIIGTRRITSAPMILIEQFFLPSNNFTVSQESVTCKGSANGSITISAIQRLNYTVSVNAPGFNSSSYDFSDSVKIRNLPPNTYNICISVAAQPAYQQCFVSVIREPKDLSLYATNLKNTDQVLLSLGGADVYHVNLNGITYDTADSQLTLTLNNGINNLEVTSDKPCQGILRQTLSLPGRMSPYPNPFEKVINVYLGPKTIGKTDIRIYDPYSKMVYHKIFTNQSNVIQLDVTRLLPGVFFLNLTTDGQAKIFKVIKKQL